MRALRFVLVWWCIVGGFSVSGYDKVIKIGAIFERNPPEDVIEAETEAEEEFPSFQALSDVIAEINGRNILNGYTVEPVVKYILPRNPSLAIEYACELTAEGVVGILGPTTPENYNAVRSVCDAKEIPLLEVHPELQVVKGNNLNVHPSPQALSLAYIDILLKWQWKSFTILYEDDESLLRMSEILKMRDNKDFRVVVRELDKNGTGNYRLALKEVWKSASTNFILDCSIEILPEVLVQAQQIGLITSDFNYFITNLDLHTLDLEPYQYSEANITGIRIIQKDPENPGKLTSDALTRDALMSDAVNMFISGLNETGKRTGKPLQCDRTDTWDNGQTLINIMKVNTYKGLTGKVSFDPEGKRSDISLDIIELQEDGLVDIGSWNASHGVFLNRTVTAAEAEEYEVLANKTFVVITCLTEPYGMLKESSTQLYGNERYEGFAIDLIDELAAMENFNYTFKIREDKKNGAKLPNGTWTGMIGDLIDHNADLAITDLTITSERAEAVDFTTQFMSLGISILYQKPKRAPPNFFSFAAPFALEVWMLLAAVYFGISVALFIMGRLSPSEWTNPYPCIEEPEFLVNQFSLRNSFWFMTGSLMQQGSEIAPISISTRMVAGMWWFFTLIMVASYTANLAAFLTTESTDSPFSNVQELVERADKLGIKYGAKDGGATANFFRDSNDTVYQRIYAYMQEHRAEVMVKDNKDGVEKAENEKYAFFMESTSIEYEKERRCNLTSYGGRLDEKGYGIAMRKNSPYRHALSTAVLKLQESGKLDDLKRKWWTERRGGGQCVDESKESEATPLNLENVGGVFGVTIAGTVLATFLVVLEMLGHVVKKSVKTKTSIKANLLHEIKFYLKFKGMVKPMFKVESEENSQKSNQTVEQQMPFNEMNGSAKRTSKSQS